MTAATCGRSVPSSPLSLAHTSNQAVSVKPAEPDLDTAVNYAIQEARRYCRKNPGVDEGAAESGAIQGAWDAVKDYDPKRPGFEGKVASWETYLFNMVRWGILKALRPTQAKSRAAFDEEFTIVPLDSPTTRVDNGLVHELVADPASNQGFATIDMANLLSLIPKMEHTILFRRYGLEQSCNEVARSLGGDWTHMKVWRMEQKGLRRLRILLGLA
jgi:hypothetical protein